MRRQRLLGQHFLRCRWVISTLVKAAQLKADDTVLEVGPGTGILTRALAERAGRVIAVEKDRNLVAQNLYRVAEKHPNVEIIEGDVLKFLEKPAPIYKLHTAGYKVVANIPYYLTSRLLRLLLEKEPKPQLVVLTIQKEVAERIAAKPPGMNLLALAVQAFGTPRIIKTVPKECFSPPPEVESAIIKISHIQDSHPPEKFWEIARRAFSQKRKMLRHSIGKMVALPPAYDTKRPEELSPEDWFKIIPLKM